MLEGAHLDFTDELGLNDGLFHDIRDELAKVRQDQVRLVVGCLV